MELNYKQTSFALSSCFLALTLALGACGEDSKSPSDDDSGSEETPGAERDAGTRTPDSGSKPGDSGSKPADSGEGEKDAGSTRDASGGGDDEDAGSTPSDETGNTIYTGGPDCVARGHKIAGTVDGKEVEFNLPMEAESTEDYFEARQAGSVNGRLRVEWSPSLDEEGEPSTIDEGILELASTYDFGPYCVLAGKAQRDSKLSPDVAYREFYTITKVQARDGTTCSGPELEADLRACTYYR
jgi:hypothetical protein